MKLVEGIDQDDRFSPGACFHKQIRPGNAELRGVERDFSIQFTGDFLKFPEQKPLEVIHRACIATAPDKPAMKRGIGLAFDVAAIAFRPVGQQGRFAHTRIGGKYEELIRVTLHVGIQFREVVPTLEKAFAQEKAELLLLIQLSL